MAEFASDNLKTKSWVKGGELNINHEEYPSVEADNHDNNGKAGSACDLRNKLLTKKRPRNTLRRLLDLNSDAIFVVLIRETYKH